MLVGYKMANASAWKCIGRGISKMRGIIATVLLLFIGLSFCVNGAVVPFKLSGATAATYRTFVQQLRDQLTVGATLSNGLPVLKSSSSVPPSQRFVVVTLTPYDSAITISVGIDVSNVYIVAFRGNNRAYFLSDAPAVAYTNLFVGVPQTKLTYSGSYIDLERAARKSRESIPLGFAALDSAISNLWYTDQSKYPASLIVIIQMVAEAARFRGIEVDISRNIQASYLPNPAILSLENNWAALSSAIRSSVNGVFKTAVTVRNQANQPVTITTVDQAKSLTGIALLLG